MALFIGMDPIMSTPSLLSLYNKHLDLFAARSPSDRLFIIHFLKAESSNHAFLHPTLSVSRRHAHDELGGGQSSFCALYGMIELIAAQVDGIEMINSTKISLDWQHARGSYTQGH